MALKDIFEKIEKEIEEELKKIEQNKSAKIKEIENKFQKEIKKRREEVIARAEKIARNKIEKTRADLDLSAKKLALVKRQEIIDKVYQVALEELVKNKERSFDLILKLLRKCPKEGVIFCSKENEEIIKKAIEKAGLTLSLSKKSLPLSNGFIFSNEILEIDNSFENLIKIIQIDTEVEVSKILFEN